MSRAAQEQSTQENWADVSAARFPRVSHDSQKPAHMIGRPRLLSFQFTVQGGITVKVLLDNYGSLGWRERGGEEKKNNRAFVK